MRETILFSGRQYESNGILDGGNIHLYHDFPYRGDLGKPGTTFYDFTVAGNVTAQSDFQVARNFTNNGVFDASAAELVMTGNTAGSIGGTTNPSTIAQLNINKTYNTRLH